MRGDDAEDTPSGVGGLRQEGARIVDAQMGGDSRRGCVGGGEGFRIRPVELKDVTVRSGVALDVGRVAVKAGEDLQRISEEPEALVSVGGAAVRVGVLQVGEKQKPVPVPADPHRASLEVGFWRFTPVLAEVQTRCCGEKIIRLPECDRSFRGDARAGQRFGAMGVSGW